MAATEGVERRRVEAAIEGEARRRQNPRLHPLQARCAQAPHLKLVATWLTLDSRIRGERAGNPADGRSRGEHHRSGAGELAPGGLMAARPSAIRVVAVFFLIGILFVQTRERRLLQRIFSRQM